MELTTLKPADFRDGFLVDEQWMAGISPSDSGRFEAFVLDHRSGELVTSHEFQEFNAALEALSRLERSWRWERLGGCGGGCSDGKGCDPSGCKACVKKGTDSCVKLQESRSASSLSTPM